MAFKPIQILKNILGLNMTEKIYPADFEPIHIDIINKVQPFTMTSHERLFSLIESVKYIVHNQIPGDIVECGVWKGGSMMAIAETLIKLGITDRQLFLYDTFAGMTAPTEADKAHDEQLAADLLVKDADRKEESVVWAFSTLEEVKKNLALINYPTKNIHFIEGDVLQTIPTNAPKKIALLRLDTDWHDSTKHEMEHLYPTLCSGGVLIIDDYGFWKGSRKAVDDYINANQIQILLNRIDDTGRIAIKQ